jgi:Lytic polysaccharide mono-oxygenase, cellulose-degrading/Chitin binding Peritrophin-A domain
MHLLLSSSVFSACLFSSAAGHGFLYSPRSRNFVASQDGKYYPLTADNPLIEDCPHCLNLGGTLARCGLKADHNYDMPQNGIGGLMHANPQATLQAGQEIVLDVLLTAHHMGHFVYKACPVASVEDIPTQACFDANPLEFVQDMLYGAPRDANYPERAYIAPIRASNAIMATIGGQSGMKFSHKFRLPSNVAGDMVLIQWHYLTANSCVHPGYDVYPFPDSSWKNQAVGVCLNIPEDGNGVPEQFWNCAETSITRASGPSVPSPTPPLPSPTPPAPTNPISVLTTPSPVPVVSPPAPTPAAPTSPSQSCCPAGYTGMKAHSACARFYHCVNGAVQGTPIACPNGLLFDEGKQLCDWANQVSCQSASSCGSRFLRGGGSIGSSSP